jgi:hypothetical protein
MPGRKRRLSRYLQAGLKRVKNLHTRRTQVATIHRDLKKLSSSNSNKRLKKK